MDITKLINNIVLRKGDLINYAREHFSDDELNLVEDFFLLIEDKERNKSIDPSLLVQLEKKIDIELNGTHEGIKANNFISELKIFLQSSPKVNIETNKHLIEELQARIVSLEQKLGGNTEAYQDQISTIVKAEMTNVESFYENVQEGIYSLDQKLEDVEKKEKILEELESMVSSDINQRNFELLSKGFQTILTSKEREKYSIVTYLILFGVFIIATPLFSILSHYNNWTTFTEVSGIIPLVTIELFMIYFFKIFLHNYNSLKEQMLQIETKRSLLGFISDYIRYKESNKISDSSIEKMEEIIFSKISPDMKQIPIAPDIMSIIEKIIKLLGKGQ